MIRWRNLTMNPAPIALVVATLCVVRAAGAAPQSEIKYARDILPILASKCFPCHGPDPEPRKAKLRLDTRDGLLGATREGAPIVTGGDLDASALWWRVGVADADDRMPPPEFGKTLSPQEIDALKQWIENGAEWEGHWAFRPLVSPSPPAVTNPHWLRNPIDAFVLAKLESLGLTPSDEADRRTMIRRLTFDLHGLPPTPEAVADFVHDNTPEAYEQLVDRLLASPRYGERWGRHWLDVAHYADTHGYDKDKRREHAWPYRDYVIDALNNDKAYGRFVEEQLAGDVLYPDDPQALVATGFIAAGPWDYVGHAELREGTVDKKITRNLDRDDMVSSTMTVFTSLTVQCARCHEHKFDPIAQEDYYALQAVFAGVDRADRSYDSDPTIHRERRGLTEERRTLQDQLDSLQARMNALTSPELDDLDEQLAELRKNRDALNGAGSDSNGYHSLVASDEDAVKWVQIDLAAAQPIDALRLVSARPTDFPDTPGFGFPLRFRIEVSNTLEFASPVTVLDQTQADHSARTDQPFRIETKGIEGRYIRITATKLWKRLEDFVFALAEFEVYSKGENIALGAAVTAADSIDAGRWHTRYLTDGFDSRRRLESSGKSSEVVALRKDIESEISARQEERETVVGAMLTTAERNKLGALEKELAKVKAHLAKLPEAQKVYAAATDFKSEGTFSPLGRMREIHLLHRGDINQPGDLSSPGTVSCIPGLPSRFSLPEGHGEGERRAALAQWISNEANPLTWRSIVNRVWHYHFGKGIVDTPNDFGRMGTPPTHRALLDWLATEFLARGQSLKELHRLIVSSATYRQVSSHDAAKAVNDSSNRFLWRMNRRQLDAEALRDTVLFISGKLDLTMGGPGFDAFVFEDDHSPRYLYDQLDARDSTAYRRSVYRFIVRSVPDPFMSSLDCADPSQSVPVRTQTITALQALALLNNPMIVRHAAYLAERVEANSDDPAAQLDAVYQLAFNRSPNSIEINALLPYAQRHGMAAACRLVLNTNEFMFVD